MKGLWQDARFAWRLLRRSPGYTAVAVATLALGVGLNAAAFSIVHAVVIRPLPYADAQRLFAVGSKAGMFPDVPLQLSWPAVERVRSEVRSFSASAGYRVEQRALRGSGRPELLQVAAVSEGFFETFGVRPRLGRLLARGGNEVVLSEALWRSRFDADPGVVGRTVSLDFEPHTVVGVASGGRSFPDGADAWTPLAVAGAVRSDPAFFAYSLVGKLRPGADERSLRAELLVVARRVQQEFPKLKDGYELDGAPLLEGQVGESRREFYVLLGASTLVLCIACSNLASLAVARAWVRRQELAVRAALGASGGRIWRQLTVESIVLGLVGGAAGAALASFAVRVFAAVAPEETPRLGEIRPDWPMVGAAFAGALLTALLFGLAASRHVAGRRLALSGFAAGPHPARSRLGGLLVAGQVALALVLLAGAGLMLETLRGLARQNPGFRTANLLELDLYRPGGRSQEDPAQEAERVREIVRDLGTVPGVEAAGAANYGLLDGTILVHAGLRVEGSSRIDPDAGFAVRARYVSPGYFQALGQPLLRGRYFEDADRIGAPSVAIVNARMALKYWGTLDVLGKRFTSSSNEKGREPWSEIVGVVSDVREFLVREAPVPEYYLPLYQGGVPETSLIVRTAVPPGTLADALTRRIWNRDASLPVSRVTTLATAIERSVGNERLHAFLLGGFAATALVMALVGTYGVIAYAVERRTREIGLRISLGATRRDILLLAGRQVFAPVVAGIAAGIAASLAAQRAIASELYGVAPGDPATLALAAGLMLLAAGLAGWIPARRAARVDPVAALHCE